MRKHLLRLEHMNAGGVLNGGASASLLTMAGTLAAWTGVDLDAAPHLSCVDLSVQYLAAATEEDVVAEARVLRRGRDLAFLDVALSSRAGHAICRGLLVSGQLVAMGQVTYRLLEPWPEG
jgi:uncharacterized protein (TIGR00369 family)